MPHLIGAERPRIGRREVLVRRDGAVRHSRSIGNGREEKKGVVHHNSVQVSSQQSCVLGDVVDALYEKAARLMTSEEHLLYGDECNEQDPCASEEDNND